MVAQRKLRKSYAHEIKEQPINWLWRPWIARGVVSVVDGEPSAGKSTMLFDLAARITTGRPMPLSGGELPIHSPNAEAIPQPSGSSGQTPPSTPMPTDKESPQPAVVHSPPSTDVSPIAPPGRVLLVPLEDPIEAIVAARLRVAGAVQSNILVLHGTDTFGTDGNVVSAEPLQLPRDLDLITAECHALKPELLVFDPFFAVLGMDEKNRYIKSNDDRSIRRVLARLKTLAEQEGVAVVLLRHLNKASGGSALKRGSGSIAISALARSVMLVGKDGAGPDSRVLAMVKTNLDAMPPSVSFRVLRNSTSSDAVSRDAESSERSAFAANSSIIQWDGVSDLSADDLVGRAAGKDLHPAVLSAAYFLKMTLLEHFKLTWAQLTALAAEESIPEITLRRAREVVPLLKACQGRNVFWTLPQPLMGDLLRQLPSV